MKENKLQISDELYQSLIEAKKAAQSLLEMTPEDFAYGCAEIWTHHNAFKLNWYWICGR